MATSPELQARITEMRWVIFEVSLHCNLSTRSLVNRAAMVVMHERASQSSFKFQVARFHFRRQARPSAGNVEGIFAITLPLAASTTERFATCKCAAFGH